MSYKRARERNRRLYKLYQSTKHCCGIGAWYNEKKARYIKCSCHDKEFKTKCRRITRKRIKRIHPDNIPQQASYRKMFDYWWIVC